MGMTYAEITLKNVKDAVKAEGGYMQDQEIRQTTITALVDTGAATLVINERLRQQLGLEIQGQRPARLANDITQTVMIADPVEIIWKNRKMTCDPLVFPGNGEVLLGAIPLEYMDLIVDPAKQELTGAHGDEIVSYVM